MDDIKKAIKFARAIIEGGSVNEHYNKPIDVLASLAQKVVDLEGVVPEKRKHRKIEEVGVWYSYTEGKYYPCDELINYGYNQCREDMLLWIAGRLEFSKVAPICYEELKKGQQYNLKEHEDRQDLGWALANAIRTLFLGKEEK